MRSNPCGMFGSAPFHSSNNRAVHRRPSPPLPPMNLFDAFPNLPPLGWYEWIDGCGWAWGVCGGGAVWRCCGGGANLKCRVANYCLAHCSSPFGGETRLDAVAQVALWISSRVAWHEKILLLGHGVWGPAMCRGPPPRPSVGKRPSRQRLRYQGTLRAGPPPLRCPSIFAMVGVASSSGEGPIASRSS